MEGIHGSLRTMPIEDLVGYLGAKRLDGTVRCERGPSQKSFVVQGGSAIMASSNDPREYLGQFLINFGHISEQQLDEAFETQRQTKVYLGRILTMIGLVETEVLEEILKLKVRETILSLMEWEHGSFHFQQDDLPPEPPGVGVAVELGSLTEEARFRRTTWEAIRQVFPETRLGLTVDRVQAAAGTLHPLDDRILEFAEAGESIEGIGLHLHATAFALHQRVYALYRRGIVKPRELPPPGEEDDLPEVEVVAVEEIPEVLGERTPVGEIVQRARAFLQEGKYAEAELVASRAAALAPEDGAAMSALREAETGLLAELQGRFFAVPLSPRLLADGDTLEAMRLAPAERYLLRRFDGQRTLRQIIRVSPIREIDALKLVRKFVDGGLVQLGTPVGG